MSHTARRWDMTMSSFLDSCSACVGAGGGGSLTPIGSGVSSDHMGAV
jgi:hypothetical protein